MEELFRTNNPAAIAFATALLRAEDIECFVFDVHTSVLEGSIGILPRRVMVPSEDLGDAREILTANEVDVDFA